MSAHFKWYPDGDAEIVPWNARYSYPSQANKAVKMTPRIPPKNGSDFAPGNVIRCILFLSNTSGISCSR